MVKIAVIMDPLESLSLKKDSTLAIIRAAQMRGHEVSYLMQEDLFYADNLVKCCARRLQLTEAFVESLDPSVVTDTPWYEAGEENSTPLDYFDVVFMRKDPPFDMNYIYITYLLERAESQGVLVINNPASLRNCNEKFFATKFAEYCPPLIVSSRADLLNQFREEQANVVFKPLDGMGGSGVFRVMAGDPNSAVVLETLTDNGRVPIMGQKFLPDISNGDKRVLLVNGEAVPFALARIPSAGEARGNLAAGGTGVGQELTERDWQIARAVGPELQRLGLSFVGIDIIGDYLTEVNVTCPTCIRELDTQYCLDIAGMLMDHVESLLNR